MTKRRNLIVPAVILGILFMALAVLYWVDSAGSLPSFIMEGESPPSAPRGGPSPPGSPPWGRRPTRSSALGERPLSAPHQAVTRPSCSPATASPSTSVFDWRLAPVPPQSRQSKTLV